MESQGIPIAIFFDDGVGAGCSLETAKFNSSLVRSGLGMCGFQVNHETSDWEPSKRFSWIGYIIDTQTGFIYASDARIEKLLCDLNEICDSLEVSDSIHFKNLASIVGQIISMSSSCGNVTQIMSRYILHLIINSRHSWNSVVTVHNQGKEELFFWRDKLRTLNGVLFWPATFVPSKVVFSDASSRACAAFVQGSDLVFHRNWSPAESQKSSTWRELATIKFSLEAFDNNLTSHRLRWNTDKT